MLVACPMRCLSPFSARLLTNAPLPPWHKATPEVRRIAKAAADHCAKKGVDIAQLAVQYSIANEDMTTCIVGSASPDNVRKWVKWADAPMDQQLLKEVLDKDPATTFVIIDEVETDSWGVGFESVTERRARKA